MSESDRIKVDEQVLEVFVSQFLKKNFVDEAPIPDVHREWWKMCCSDKKYVAIAAPRGHAKSTALTFAYGLATLVFRERKFIVILSDTVDQACLFLGNYKRELEENVALREMFGITGLAKEKNTESDIIIEFADGYRARVMAKGSEQKFRGLNWDGTRPDLILCDDMENDEIVLNAERREKFKRWFIGAVTPSLSKYGVIRIVGTVLHQDSLLENYMPKAWDRKAGNQSTKLKIVSNPNKGNWLSAKYKAHPAIMDYSEMLWPEYKTAELLRAEYEAQKALGVADVYAQEQLNEPIDESTSLFRKGDFGTCEEDEISQPLNYYIGFDLATSKDNVKRDATTFVVGGVNAKNNLYIIKVIAERMDTLEAVDTILRLQQTYQPMAFISEKGQLANALEPFLRVRMYETNTFPSIITYPAMDDKVKRSSSIRGRMRAGAVKFLKSADWFEKLQQECLQFPRSVHDDQVDALSWLGVGLDKLIEAPTTEELEEAEYEQEKEDSWELSGGQNDYTGY